MRYRTTNWMALVLLASLCLAPVASYGAEKGPPVPPTLRLPLGLEAGASFRTRLEAAHALGKHLTRPEIDALYAFMRKTLQGDALAPVELNAMKNDMATALLQQADKPKDFGRQMMAMSRDPALDAVWRDYCVQFLGAWYAYAPGDERREIRDARGDRHAPADRRTDTGPNSARSVPSPRGGHSDPTRARPVPVYHHDPGAEA